MSNCQEVEAKLDALAEYLGVSIEWCNHEENDWIEEGCLDCDGKGIKIRQK